MGKRARVEPTFDGPAVIRTGWLHQSSGDAIPVRQIMGCIQKWIGTDPDYGCYGGWAWVPVCEYGLIEWEGEN